MRIDIETNVPIPAPGPDMVGNVYPVRGGSGARHGHMHVIIAHYDKVVGCCRYSGYVTVTVDSFGAIIGANNYGCHYFDEKMPIARVDGLDQISLVMRSL